MNDPGSLPGTLCYFEIPASDLEVASRFYAEALGWKTEHTGNYVTCIAADGTLQCGLDPTRQAARDAGVLIYLKVTNIESAMEAIVQAGGTVVQEKQPVGADASWGFSAVFRDPSGNSLGLWCKS